MTGEGQPAETSGQEREEESSRAGKETDHGKEGTTNNSLGHTSLRTSTYIGRINLGWAIGRKTVSTNHWVIGFSTVNVWAGVREIWCIVPYPTSRSHLLYKNPASKTSNYLMPLYFGACRLISLRLFTFQPVPGRALLLAIFN